MTNEDAFILALGALRWIVADGPRCDRLFGVTGLTPDSLRSGAGEPAVLAALLAFLEAHEPDLIACAEAMNVAPEELVRAHALLEAM
ncbi:DUF3572 family protein [Stakelama tenebrarum]|uniref:DUF3572 family protein n=1 Tax=Stakelama tenebrarum TaxID=2711215 RepID=UPI00389A4383